MSQGLGTVQRKLLVALYSAENFNGRWMQLAEHPDIGSDDDSGPWFAISQLHLVETDHAERFEYAAEEATTLRDREFKRSRRTPYRRALRTLEQRGLAEAKLVSVDLDDLGQYSYFWHGGPTPVRDVWLARLTDQGRAWVEKNAAELVESAGYKMMQAAENFDPVPRWGLAAEATRARPRRPSPAAVVVPEVATVDRVDALSKSEVADVLCNEGFDAGRVSTVLRVWHREGQLQQRRQYGQPGPGLSNYVFGIAEIDELRQRLAEDETVH